MTLTATYNNNTIINTTSDGTFTLPTANKYMSTDIVLTASGISSLTATYNGNNIVNASADGTFTLKTGGKYMNSNVVISVSGGSQTPITAMVSGLGSSSPSSVNFTVDNDFTVAGLGIEEVTMGGDTFIKIPTMYRKVNTVSNNQITSFTIANTQIDNTYEPYSVFVKEDGVTVMPYVLIGKYWNTSSSSCVSTGTASPVGMTIGTGRTYAKNRGTGYQIFDWQFQKLWQDLIIVFKRTINTNAGTAWTYDEMGIYWSTNGSWIDGICHNSAVIAVSDKPSKYVDSATTSTDGYFGVSYNLPTSNGGNITALGYDMSNPFVNFPSAASGSSYTTYYCDGYYYASGSHPVVAIVGSAYAYYGAFLCDAEYNWSSTSRVRLCYRPISA